MESRDLLRGKRVLIVDDEQDVLDTLKDLLSVCEIKAVTTFEEAKKLLETQSFDIAILDIMGVQGYRLLEIARDKKVMPVMLTANALSVNDTVKSYRKGAASFVPKEEMVNIVTFLNDILEAKEQGKHFWWRWLDRFAFYYDKKFGSDWKSSDKDFWEDFPHYM